MKPENEDTISALACGVLGILFILICCIVFSCVSHGAEPGCFPVPSYAWESWPPADQTLTNKVAVQWRIVHGDWDALWLTFTAESNTLYQAQFCTNLRGPWLAYANVFLTNRTSTNVTVDTPVFCESGRFLRIMR